MKRAAIIAAVLLVGCVTSKNNERRDRVATRAAFDLNCPQEQIQITQLDKMGFGEEIAWGVRGCGKQATYLLDGKSNQIVRNSELTDTPTQK